MLTDLVSVAGLAAGSILSVGVIWFFLKLTGFWNNRTKLIVLVFAAYFVIVFGIIWWWFKV